jgi:hypothetical protein
MHRETLLIPGSSGEIRAQRDSRPWAFWSAASVLSFKPEASPAPDPALPILLWSGSLAELIGGNLFDDDPHTWGPKGWSAIEHACTRLSPGRQLILRPHHRQVISDIPSCKRLLECDWAAHIRLAYDPLAMCTRAMLDSPKRDDFLHRMFEAAESLPPTALAAIILPQDHNATPLLATLLQAHIPTNIPLLLSPP